MREWFTISPGCIASVAWACKLLGSANVRSHDQLIEFSIFASAEDAETIKDLIQEAHNNKGTGRIVSIRPGFWKESKNIFARSLGVFNCARA